MTLRPSAILLSMLLTLGGCTGSSAADDDDSGTGGSDDDTSGDDDDVATRAVLSYEGSAQIDQGSYVGTEDLVLVSDEGMGDELCRVSYTLTSTAERDDCSACSWAFDLVVSGPAITAEAGVGCAAFGYTTADITSLDGSTRAYGYAEEYVGHANMLMVHDGSLWQGLSFATFDEPSGGLSYGWDDAYVTY